MRFSEKGFKALALIRKQFPKTCSCGRIYTYGQWRQLPDRMLWELPWGEVQELRNCACRSTMGIVIVEDPTGGLGKIGSIEGLNENLSIRLEFFKVNRVYGFKLGEGMLQLEHEPMFYEDRDEAVEAAKQQGLVVEKSGVVRHRHHGTLKGEE